MARPLIFGEEEAEQIHAMRLSGMSYPKIGAKVYCDPMTVFNTLLRHGYYTPRLVKYTDELKENIRRLYLTGTKKQKIALILKVEEKAVNNIIYNEVRHGRLPRRTRNVS